MCHCNHVHNQNERVSLTPSMFCLRFSDSQFISFSISNLTYRTVPLCSLEDLVAHDEIINVLTNLIDSGSCPHLLFYGPPGTGKVITSAYHHIFVVVVSSPCLQVSCLLLCPFLSSIYVSPTNTYISLSFSLSHTRTHIHTCPLCPRTNQCQRYLFKQFLN